MNNELIKLTEAELEDLATSWGYPRFRAKQIHEWVHRHHAASFDTMSNLPKDLRTKLSEFFPLETVKIFDRQISLDGTRKYVVTLADGSLVETVGMPVYHRDGSLNRLSVCVSSQVGCPMACQFCATGREGLTRNLTAAEIIAQVALIQEDFQERVSNVVVMGQGEPFLNYDEVLAALRILNSRDDFNIGARHITLSTCGIIDGIDRLSQEPEQFTLAVSLHSALQKKRDRLMPKVAKQPLSDLKKAVERYTVDQPSCLLRVSPHQGYQRFRRRSSSTSRLLRWATLPCQPSSGEHRRRIPSASCLASNCKTLGRDADPLWRGNKFQKIPRS